MRSPSPGASASVLPWLAGLLVLAGGLAVLDAVEGRESPPSVAPAVVAREVDAVIDARLAAEGVAPAWLPRSNSKPPPAISGLKRHGTSLGSIG